MLDVAAVRDVGNFGRIRDLGGVVEDPLAAVLTQDEGAALVGRWENDDKRAEKALAAWGVLVGLEERVLSWERTENT